MKQYAYVTKDNPYDLPHKFLSTLCSTTFQGVEPGAMCQAISAWPGPGGHHWIVCFSVNPSPIAETCFPPFELYSSIEWPQSWHSAWEVT